MKHLLKTLSAALAAVLLTVALGGCSDDNDRKPTAAEGAAADAKRQSSVDALNIPQAQKDAMKAHMGGASGPPTDAAARGGK